MGIFPLPGFETTIRMGAHRQYRVPYPQPTQKIHRCRTDRGDPHIGLLRIIKRRWRGLFDDRYLKSLLCQPER
ncbi:hypothetical protein D3C80_1024650 [compost metagenome]